tara:strand:- start:727 stop:1077 length:351 start_codon:yes stop_codon:yes gene_type:complete
VEKDMTVYISQHVRGRNYEDASKFGDLEVLVPNVENINLYSTAPVVRSMNRKLRDFCDEDYILFSGDPVAIAIASVVAAKINRGRFKALKWDRQEAVYYPLTISTTGTGGKKYGKL